METLQPQPWSKIFPSTSESVVVVGNMTIIPGFTYSKFFFFAVTKSVFRIFLGIITFFPCIFKQILIYHYVAAATTFPL